jgi:hypothetical protein
MQANPDYKKYAFYLIGIFLVSKLILGLIFPIAALDGPWFLSHAFSIINGHQFKNSFASDYITFYNLPYLYGDICALLYLPFAHTNFNIYSIFIINTALLAILMFLCYKVYTLYKKADLVFILFTLSILFSPTCWLQRPETMELIVILLFHLFISKKKQTKSISNIIVAGLLIAIAGLIHPVAAVYMAVFFSFYCWENKLPLKYFISVGVTAGLLFVVLYSPLVFMNYNEWKLNMFTRLYTHEERSATIENLTQFVGVSIPFLGFVLLFFFLNGKNGLLKEVFIILLFTVVLLFFGRYYYFIYLLHTVLWRISKATFASTIKSWQKVFVALFFIPGFIQTLALPVFQIIENRHYAPTYTTALKEARSIALTNPDKNVWVSPFFGMSVIDQPNGRMHQSNYVKLRGEKPVITNDVFLVEHLKFEDYLKKFIDTSTDSLVVKNIVPPVKGLVLFGIHGKRSDSLGLWAVTVIKK